jgi:hypothetical protein
MEIDSLNEITFAQAKSALMDAIGDAEFVGVETILDDEGDETIGLRFSNDTLLLINEFYIISTTHEKPELN